MPELPEVETVRLILKQQIIGKRIKEVKVFYNRLLENCHQDEFINKLTNQVIIDLWRYAKYLMIVTNDFVIAVHLRMEGKFHLYRETHEPSKHEHLAFVFDDDIVLYYHDTRKFGRFLLLPKEAAFMTSFISMKKLGPEANTPVNSNDIYQKIIKSRLPVKTVLLDQSIISGLGNIYVNEVLFKAKISPFKSAYLITLEEVETLLDASKSTLEEAILSGGTTIRSYTSSLGVTGRFAQQLKVHGNENLPCHDCGSKIKKIQLNGRGTYYCPTCQTNPKPLVIGVTGNIGSGKTTLIKSIKDSTIKIIHLDDVVHALYDQQSFIDGLMELFPELKTIIASVPQKNNDNNDEPVNKNIVRATMSRLVKEVPNNFDTLNEYVIPLVRTSLTTLIEKTKELGRHQKILVEIPLLFETDFVDVFDYIIVVVAPREQIKDRVLSTRDIAEKDIDVFLDQQIDHTKIKYQKPNIYYFDNSGNLKEALIKFKQVIKEVT